MNNIQNKDIQTPLVSICCLTYNMENYLRQALESLLMQRTSFSYEIILHDDASTDGTRKIIEEYTLSFPHIIKPIYQQKNKHSISGFNFEFEEVLPKAIGKYIAYCDGDDYWIDPLKLQKQVDFLETHPDYGMVHNKAAKYYEENEMFKDTAGHDFDDFDELITECTVVHSSVCYRNSLLNRYLEIVKPQEKAQWTTNDFPMWLFFIQHSKIKFINEITTVYRVRNESVSHITDASKGMYFVEGVCFIVDYYLSTYSNVKNKKKIRARYYSNLIKMYFLDKRWDGIHKSAKIFYDANDWLNLLWITITLPFFYSKVLVKSSYWMRNKVFNLFNIYPIKK